MIIKNLTFSYGDKPIFDGFELDIPCGKVSCIMGESGCGKTTLLNCISRQLSFDGEIIYVQGNSDLQSDTSISYVFQQPRLIPSMTVKDNIKYVLKGSGQEREAKAQDILAKMKIVDCANAYPRFISGGQAGRASLARALATDSGILLMDEPFKGLDLKLKNDILLSLLPLIKDKTVVFVTHDVEEALAVGDIVYVFERQAGNAVSIAGKEQIDMPKENRNLYCEKLNSVRQSLFNLLTK